MTRRSRTPSPVSSFGPELLETLLRGAVERVEIPCDSMEQMMFLQLRLQTLRGAMKRESHPQYALVSRARTSRKWDHEAFPMEGRKAPMHATGCVLVIQPNDAQFRDILSRAGIKPTENAQDILENPHETPLSPPLIEMPVSPSDPYARFKS